MRVSLGLNSFKPQPSAFLIKYINISSAFLIIDTFIDISQNGEGRDLCDSHQLFPWLPQSLPLKILCKTPIDSNYSSDNYFSEGIFGEIWYIASPPLAEQSQLVDCDGGGEARTAQSEETSGCSEHSKDRLEGGGIREAAHFNGGNKGHLNLWGGVIEGYGVNVHCYLGPGF